MSAKLRFPGSSPGAVTSAISPAQVTLPAGIAVLFGLNVALGPRHPGGQAPSRRRHRDHRPADRTAGH
jgi:hypothetical protein